MHTYTLPATPAATAAVSIGRVAVRIALLLTGELTITGDPPPPALTDLTRGLTIRGLGSGSPRISAPAGHRFVQHSHDFQAPDTVTFAGECAVHFTTHDVTVTGDVGYALTVTAAGKSTSDGWFTRELGAIGLVLLIAAPMH